MVRPDAVLFNGGFFAPATARARVIEALTAWFGDRPRVLENERPEAAVAVGAAFYARLRHDPGAAKRLLIQAGQRSCLLRRPRGGRGGPPATRTADRGVRHAEGHGGRNWRRARARVHGRDQSAARVHALQLDEPIRSCRRWS